MRVNGIPGLSLAVVKAGQVAAVDALGVSDYWTRTPMTPDTLVEVASNSKIITALGAIREIPAGALNLEQPLAEYRPDFSVEGEYADQITLEMLLTHTAGMSNALGRTPVVDQAPDGQFRYSGIGFEVAGSLVAHDAGTDLPQALRNTVLTPLGISERATYARVGDSTILASPHVSMAQMLLLLVLPGFAVFTILFLIIWLAGKIGIIKHPPETLPLWILAVSVAASMALMFYLVSFGNAVRYALVDVLFIAALFALVMAIRKWRLTQRVGFAVSSVFLIVIIALSVLWHTPVPLKERGVGHPAAAGFRASAQDMGQLLTALVNPPAGWEADIGELTTPRVRVNDENQWGLGIGIQEIDGNRMIWHWGINYPGYQSLMLGNPETGDGLVILMNGGTLLFAPGGGRWSGLEIARELAGRMMPGPHGAYWHGIQ